jgi:hypothetical protein
MEGDRLILPRIEIDPGRLSKGNRSQDVVLVKGI